MNQHQVEIRDSNSKAVMLEVTVPPIGDPSWRVKYHNSLNSLRFLRLQEGVADRGPGGPAGNWLCCYGGREMDDDKLVFHLDEFFSGQAVNQSGSGKLYNHDNLLMVPGALTWRRV